MNRWSLISSTFASAALLAACAHLSASGQGFSLGYVNDTGEGAKLTYGQPGTDNVPVMFVCPLHSGRVKLSDSEHDGSVVRLMAGSQTAALTGRVIVSDEGDWVDIDIAADSPVMQAFRASGRIEMISGSHHLVIAANGAKAALVQNFFTDCAKP